MKKKFIYFRLLPLIVTTVLLTSCSYNLSSQNNNTSQPGVNSEVKANSINNKNTSPVSNDMITYDKDDYYSDWKNESPNYIELSGNSASIKGSGAVVKEGKVTITAAGVYVLSGKFDNGQIIVDVQNKGSVRLVLNGVKINSTDNAPIYIKNSGKTIITLQDGTDNTITDGEKYVLADPSADEPTAAIFSKSDLTINGTGKLNLRGNYKDGITSKDDLKIIGGNINVYSVDDGLVGRDMVLVKEGTITIEAAGDGIKSTNDTDPLKGFIAFQGGTFDIQAGADGIQAETSILINDGKYTIVSGGGSAKASVKISDNRQGPMGRPGNTTTSSSSAVESESRKAIKASSDITIAGGTFNIDSADDAVHSNNTVNIAGGDISIISGDDGIHGDSSILIKGGKVDIRKSYEGIESSLITISGGETYIISSDDGVNVAGGKDGSAVNGRPGENNFNSAGNNKLVINGGYISVDALGDGLDSNGSITMTGGTVVVTGPTANNNGALDYDGAFEMTGGFLIAAGSSGMVQAPSEQSTQYSIAMNYSQIQQAGTLIHLEDSKGNNVVTFAPKKNYQSVVVSSPELKKDIEYTLYSGGRSTGSSSDGLYKEGMYENGTKIVGFTIATPVTWLSESGVTTGRNSGAGGPANPGFGGGKGRSGSGKP